MEGTGVGGGASGSGAPLASGTGFEGWAGDQDERARTGRDGEGASAGLGGREKAKG